MNPLTRNWLLLVAMVVATTLLAPFSGAAVTAALLVLAFLKAGAILGGAMQVAIVEYDRAEAASQGVDLRPRVAP